MKILFASATDSGILRVRSELISELLSRGNEVVVATPKEKDYRRLEDMGCKFISVKIDGHGMNLLKDFFVYRQYKSILKSERPDMVFLFTTKANIYCGMVCRELAVPSVMNITGMGMAMGNKGLIQIIMIYLYKFACNGKNMKRIFFQNDDSLEFFRKHRIGSQSIYKRIPGSGVNLEKFTVQPFPNSDTVDFLFIARIMKQKGIDEYIEAARKVRETHPEAVFHVLGNCDDDYKAILEEENKKGTIVYHGRMSNIIDFEKISQCTIQPSYYPEGMSNVILEAAASGRPVITTDHPGCREGVDDGITGFIIPTKSASALVAAIEKMLSMTQHEKEEMGLRGREKMEKEFDRVIVTKAYLSLVD